MNKTDKNDPKLIKECLDLYKDGSSRMEVARHIMSETGLKETASKVRAKNIWDENFDNDYDPKNALRSEEAVSPEKATFDEKKDTATAESKSSNIRTLEDLIDVCKIDLNIWEIERYIVNKWEVAAKGLDGVMKHSPLYQVKAWLKKKEVTKAKEVIEFFKKELLALPRPVKTKNASGKYVYEISIPDLHLSKLCWGKETGYEDYDIKIASNLFKEAMHYLVSKVEVNTLDKIVLPIGNDFFNSEGLSGMTTKGTRQDDDSRWPKSFQVGCNLIAELVDELSESVNVDIIIVPGNHDFERCFYLGEFLSAWYRNNDAVRIDNSPTSRKYVSFGKNLILFTHGNEEKAANLPLLMATENPNFSDCKFRTAHLGHFHGTEMKEYNGVKVRILPSLCAPDAWHSNKGYVGNVRSATAFLYEKDNGEVANFYYNI
jgi:predicted phosphodiesterase